MKETFIKINNKKNSSQPQQLQNISCLVPKPLLEMYEIGLKLLLKAHPDTNYLKPLSIATLSKKFKSLCLWLYIQSITNEAKKEEKEYLEGFRKSLTSLIYVPSKKMIKLFNYNYKINGKSKKVYFKDMLDILQSKEVGFLRPLENKYSIEETIEILCDGETDFMPRKKDPYFPGEFPKYVNMGDWIKAEDLELVDINILELYNAIVPHEVDEELQEKFKKVYNPDYYRENFVYDIIAYNDWLKYNYGNFIGLTVKHHTVKPKFYNHVSNNYRLMKFISLSKGYYNITESEKTGRIYTSLTLLPSDASQFITLKSGKKMVSLDGSNFSLAALSTLFKKYGINNDAIEIFNIKTAEGKFYEALVAVLKKYWNNRYTMSAKELEKTYCGNIQNVIETIFKKTGIKKEVDDKFLREFVKPLVFGNFLFNNNPPKNGKFARIINEAFGPGLYDALEELNIKIKEELIQQNILEDTTLAAVYQTLESNIFIKEILKDKRFDNGDIFVYTKHDSIIVDEDHVDIIEDILEKGFKKYNVMAAVKEEVLNAKKEFSNIKDLISIAYSKEEPVDIIKEPVVEYINKNQNVMKKKEEDFETLIEYCYYIEEDGMLWILSKDMYNEYTNSDEYKEGEYFWHLDRYFHKDTNETFLEFYNGIDSLDEDGVYVGDGVSIGPWG